MKVTRALGVATILAFTAGSAMAAPCATGTTKSATPDKQASNPKSSDVDKGSANLAGGNQPASPGTVGAMNNAGATQANGTAPGAGTTANNADPAAKNNAGGNQPASPGTVGAMNNAAAARSTTNMADKDC